MHHGKGWKRNFDLLKEDRGPSVASESKNDAILVISAKNYIQNLNLIEKNDSKPLD